LLLAGDPDAWLILLAMTTISLFPLGLLWYAIRLMKVAYRDTGQAEESERTPLNERLKLPAPYL
jgi:hypothetical protein